MRTEGRKPKALSGTTEIYFYGCVGASGGIGAFVFLTQLLAGRDVSSALPNLMVQLGVIGIVIVLFRLERRNQP